MGKKKPAVRDGDSTAPAVTGKSKKKVLIDDDEYSVGTELSEDIPPVEEEKAVITGKKKGKKGSSKAQQLKEDDEDAVDDDEDVAPIAFTGKKKGKGKKSGTVGSGFGLLGDDDDSKDRESDEEEEEAPVLNFGGKKKSSKKNNKGGGSVFASSGFAALDEEDEVDPDEEAVVDNEDEDVPVVAFTGKKKKSSKGKKGGAAGFSSSAFGGLDEEDDEGSIIDNDDEDVPVVAFTGKKKPSKSSKKGGATAFSSFDTLGEEDEEQEKIEEEGEDEASAISFSGKKKSSKSSKKTAGNEGDFNDSSAAEVTSISHDTKAKKEDVPETSKNKKKNKKKSGRTAQEEDDLDKLLAELGEGPVVSKPPEPQPQEEKVDPNPEPVAQVEQAPEKEGAEPVESAAAKKNRKKKEKEKEKKAAAAAKKGVKNEVIETEPAETKKTDKKVPKAVREMQEAMARLKEREEKMKREEEERLRKEEEERLKQEELARQLEEAKRKKKEREKEKLLKKKQEGKLLTAKQKDEARRLAAFREQLLANVSAEGLPVVGDTGSGPTKRPIYKTKKSKAGQNQANGAGAAKEVQSSVTKEIQKETISEADSSELDKIEEVEAGNDDDKLQADAEKENGVEEEDDDDEEWDAKSWDDVNLAVKSSFAEEEADSEPDVAKETKSVTPPSHSAVTSTEEKSTSDSGASGARTVKSKGAKAAPSTVPKSTEPDLRSPICCIMGHVDTGKTKLLDCIRGTNVQEGEAGGITQQIGATYFPADNIRDRTRELKADATLKVPGLLVIDTPGHESFTNLRSRGSGLCDIAILVVDIMHGLEPQTIESLNLLKMRNTEFIVALNKVDRLYGWKACKNAPIIKAMKQQSKDVQNEFNMRLVQIVTQLKEQGLNTELYYKNKDRGDTYNIVPTSAISGEGIPDLLLLLVQWTQKTMVEKLTFRDELECTVLEVKVIEGHGTTIDVVLVNGILHEGDQIVVCGLQGPIVTTIRALLTPHPMKELRVKGTYLHHKEIKAAQGIKITAQGLEHAIAGTGLYVVGPDDDLEDVTELAMEDMKNVMSRIDKTGEGVYVQASTLGSLEALLEFLKSPAVTIPVSGIGIGPVHKKDVMKASTMLEKKKEYATILAFDVKVTPEARELADETGVKIFTADIIYHLFDQFKAYIDNIKEEKKKETADEAVFPCVLQILPNCVFNKKDPIVLGVDILEGIAKVGTPICVPTREFIDIGRISSIENNHKPVDTAKKGQKVAIKIVGSNSEEHQKMFGRHFEMEDQLVSHISRKSIDILKTNYRDDLSIEDWKLVVKLKNIFKIQ